MGLFARRREAAAPQPAEQMEATPQQPPRKAVKLKAAALEPVTPEAFDALRRKFEALQKITALAVLAVENGLNCSPGHPDSKPVSRLAKIAAVASEFGLSAAETKELRRFIDQIGTAGSAERRREQREATARLAPRTFDNCRVPSWRG